MPASAVLLMDLQRDFLDPQGRMPVAPRAAVAVIAVANEILARKRLPEAWPLLVRNEFPASDRIGNFFRHRAALAGSPGAAIDPRLQVEARTESIAKSRPSAFTNAPLEPLLRSRGVRELYLLGVFAEGCVRATARDALARGFRVHVIEDAVASDAGWKRRFGLWAMKRAGATMVSSRDLPSA